MPAEALFPETVRLLRLFGVFVAESESFEFALFGVVVGVFFKLSLFGVAFPFGVALLEAFGVPSVLRLFAVPVLGVAGESPL